MRYLSLSLLALAICFPSNAYAGKVFTVEVEEPEEGLESGDFAEVSFQSEGEARKVLLEKTRIQIQRDKESKRVLLRLPCTTAEGQRKVFFASKIGALYARLVEKGPEASEIETTTTLKLSNSTGVSRNFCNPLPSE